MSGKAVGSGLGLHRAAAERDEQAVGGHGEDGKGDEGLFRHRPQ